MKKTMTVSELINCLNKFPQDMPVFAEWEGVFAPIREENIEINDPMPHEKIDALIIYVEDY